MCLTSMAQAQVLSIARKPIVVDIVCHLYKASDEQQHQADIGPGCELLFASPANYLPLWSLFAERAERPGPSNTQATKPNDRR